MNTPHSLTSSELQSRTDAALELARFVNGMSFNRVSLDGRFTVVPSMALINMQILARRALGSIPEIDAEFSRFLNWARSEGKDCAHTFDSEANQWVALNPVTADLWRAWRVAAGVATDQPNGGE